jgi:hypothetical protein
MSVGSVQTVLVCAPGVDTVSPCPAGTAPTPVSAYVVASDSASLFDAAVGPYDYANGAFFWGTAFTFTLTLYFAASIYRSILKLVR